MFHRHRLVLFPLLAALTLTACTAGHRITRLNPEDQITNKDIAAYYALPRTVVVTSFSVKRIDTLEGKKVQQKACIESLNDPAAWLPGSPPPPLWQVIGMKSGDIQAGAAVKVVGTPTLTTAAEPDPKQVFRVDLSSSAFTKREVDLVYGPLGVLKEGTSSAADKRLDLALATFQSLAKVAPVFFAATNFELDPALSLVEPIEVDLVVDLDLCQETAKKVYEARETIAGLSERVRQGGLDEKQAQWIKEQLEEKIAELHRVFFLQKETTGTIVCAVRPENTGLATPTQILQLDPKSGFTTASRVECIIPAQFVSTGTPTILYELALSRYPEQMSEVFRTAGLDRAHSDREPQGFYYRVPAVVQAKVTVKEGTNQKVALDQDLVVAQLGIVAALPRQRTYQTKYKITLDPETGGLKTLFASSEAIDKSLITDSGNAVSGYLETEAERRKAEAEAKDELTLLERERKILDERKKIRDLKKELGTSDDD